jgi:hypothetical protein
MTQRQELLAALGCGAVVGGIGGYFFAERKYRLKYRILADVEVESVKEHYRAKEAELLDEQKRVASQPKPNLELITNNLKEKAKAELIAEGEGYVQREDPEGEESEEVEAGNAFDRPPLPPWDYDREMAGRNADFPWIMHFEEYQQSECSHQVTITYFEGDDVLIDESDEVISKKDEVVGMENLEKFGHGSSDPNVVYVRNPKLDVEYEILRHEGHYAKEILGLEEEPNLEHSAIPRRRPKFDDGT